MIVFPAHAGMSPRNTPGVGRILRFPRSRGDEPILADIKEGEESFSPLTRG